MYNRNNGREIAARLVALRDDLFANADKTYAVNIKDSVLFNTPLTLYIQSKSKMLEKEKAAFSSQNI